MDTKAKRIGYVDIIRAIAIILLVTGHTMGYSQNSQMVYKWIYSFVVPMFFMVSGFVMRRKGSFVEFIKIRFIRIMVPYFVWAVLYIIPYKLMGGTVATELGKEVPADLLSILKNVLYGIGKGYRLHQNSSLWFLPALFVMDCAFYIITSMIEKLNTPLVSFAFLAVLAFVGFMADEYLNIDLPWGINTLLVAGIYYYVGWILRVNNGIKRMMDSSRRSILIIALFGVGLIAGLKNSLLNFMGYSIGNIWLAYTSGICLSIAFMCLAYGIKENNVLEYVGRNTMAIMLFHKIPVIVFQTKMGVLTQMLKNSNIFVEVGLCVTIALLALVFSLCISVLLRKYTPILIGERRST